MSYKLIYIDNLQDQPCILENIPVFLLNDDGFFLGDLLRPDEGDVGLLLIPADDVLLSFDGVLLL